MSQETKTPNYLKDLSFIYDSIHEKIDAYRKTPFEAYLNINDLDSLPRPQKLIFDILIPFLKAYFEKNGSDNLILIQKRDDDIILCQFLDTKLVSLCIKSDGDCVFALFDRVNEPESSLIMSGDYLFDSIIINQNNFLSSVEFLFSII